MLFVDKWPCHKGHSKNHFNPQNGSWLPFQFAFYMPGHHNGQIKWQFLCFCFVFPICCTFVRDQRSFELNVDYPSRVVHFNWVGSDWRFHGVTSAGDSGQEENWLHRGVHTDLYSTGMLFGSFRKYIRLYAPWLWFEPYPSCIFWNAASIASRLSCP